MSIDYAIVVKSKTRLESLIERFNTKAQAKSYIENLGGDFNDYDVWADVFGEDFAEAGKERECGNLIYKKAWQWALSFSKEERTKKFQEMRQKYQK